MIMAKLISKRLKDICPGDYIMLRYSFEIVVCKSLIDKETQYYRLTLLSENHCYQLDCSGDFSVIHTWNYD